MTTRIIRDGDTNRIKIVESDDRSESHERLHNDTDMGYNMRKNNIREATGSSEFHMKRDLDSYSRAVERVNDTKYSESDRRAYEQKADRIKRKYNLR